MAKGEDVYQIQLQLAQLLIDAPTEVGELTSRWQGVGYIGTVRIVGMVGLVDLMPELNNWCYDIWYEILLSIPPEKK